MSLVFCLYHLIIFDDMFTFFEKKKPRYVFFVPKKPVSLLWMFMSTPEKLDPHAYDL